MVSSSWSTKCFSALLVILYTCSQLQPSECISSNKQLKNHSNVKVANLSTINSHRQPLFRRHRRRLPLNETNDQQLNSLDDTGLQYQEYQGVFGKPGVDFPVLSRIPITKFNCRNVKNSNTGYYADLETNCQVFHVCDSGRKVSFLCPNGTIFHQSHLICDWWFRVECERSPELYDQSVQQLKADQNLYKQRAETISNAMHNALSKGVTDSMLLQSPVSVTNKVEYFNSQGDGLKSPSLNYPSSVTGSSPSNSQFTSLPSSIPQNTASQTLPSQNFQSRPFGNSPQKSNFNVEPGKNFQQNYNTFNAAGNSQPLDAVQLGFDQIQTTFNTQPTLLWSTQTNVISTDPPRTTYFPNLNSQSATGFNSISLPKDSFNIDFKNKTTKFNSLSQLKTQNIGSTSAPVTSQRSTVSPTLPPISTTSFTGSTNSQAENMIAVTAIPGSINNYYMESQVPAETAGFAESGKFPEIQDYYYNQNYINQQNYKIPEATSQPNPGSPSTAPLDLTTYNVYQTFSNNSFALYYPSSGAFDDSASSKPSVSGFLLNVPPSSGSGSVESPLPETVPVLLTNHTKTSYNQLFFSIPAVQTPTTTPITKSSDLQTQFSNGLMQASSPKSVFAQTINEKLKLKSSPNFRELAQIFSRALSAYLEDPEQFRQILSEVRPTEPPSTNTKEYDKEVLDFSEDERTTLVPSAGLSSTTSQSIRDPETFAEEINNFMFDPFTTVHTDSAEFNVNHTYYPSSFNINTTTPVTFTVPPLIDYKHNTTMFGTTRIHLPPSNINLYGDKGSNKFSDFNAQSLQDEPVLQTADTQSFLSPDNVLRYQNYKSFNIKPPSLKSPAYPQFGKRTTAAFISSRSDFLTPKTTVPNNISYNLNTTTVDDQSLRTTFNMLSSHTSKPIFNETAVNAMVNMMHKAKTNAELRKKLILLLVNNKSNPSETKSDKEMKSELLNALVLQQPTKAYDNSYTQHPINRRKMRKESRRVSLNHQVFSATPQYTSTEISKSTEPVIRSGRSTNSPSQQIDSDRLSDQDSRAVDLLKTLYSIASNN